jgi:uncharacterized repeat protein (TIGR01451 family)
MRRQKRSSQRRLHRRILVASALLAIALPSFAVGVALLATMGVSPAWAVCVPTVYNVTSSAPPPLANWTTTTGALWQPSGGFPGCAPGDVAQDLNVSPTTVIVNSAIPNPIIGLNWACSGCLVEIDSGGSLALSGAGNIGSGATVRVNGGTLALGTSGTLTFQSGASLQFDAGQIDINSGGHMTFQSGASLLLAAGQININAGGQMTVTGTPTVPSGFHIAVNGGTLTVPTGATLTFHSGAFLDLVSGTVDGGGSIINAGSAAMQGPGTLTFASTLTGTPAVEVNGGTLAVTGSVSSPVNVNSGGALAGTGTVGAVTVNSGGTLAPGLSPGSIATGNLSLPAASTLSVDIDGTAAGTGYDQVMVSGTVVLGGTLSVTLGFTPTPGDVFKLIDNDGSSDAGSGIFLGLLEGAILTASGHRLRVSYIGGDGNDVTLTALADATGTIGKQFGAPSVPLNGTTTLTFTLTNPNTTALTGVAFTDTLPAGLTVPDETSPMCGGTLTISANTITLSGATIAASGTCTFARTVTGTAAGTKSNTTGAMTSTEGGSAGTATASLDVVAPPTIGKAFGAPSIVVGQTTSLTLTLTNPAANAVALTGVAVTDPLPVGLVVATPANLANTCGGTPVATAGSGSLSLSGGSIAVASSCTVSADVTANAAGPYTNTTQAVTSTNGGTGPAASAGLNVSALPPTHLVVSAPSAATAGNAITVTVTALDQLEGVAAGYSGTVNLSSTDAAASLPSSTTLTAGTGTFSATLKTAGPQTITATDSVSSALDGTSGTITVSPGATTRLTIAAPSTADTAHDAGATPTTSSAGVSFTVTALDQFGNVTPGYAGIVHFTSSDARATLPPDSPLPGGTATLSATLRTPGPQTITATDTVDPTISGSATVVIDAVPIPTLSPWAMALLALVLALVALGISRRRRVS